MVKLPRIRPTTTWKGGKPLKEENLTTLYQTNQFLHTSPVSVGRVEMWLCAST